MEKQKKLRTYFTIFGLLVVAYSCVELFLHMYSTKQSLIFIVEGLMGVALIYVPEAFRKVFKLHIPSAIVYFYWFFLFLSVFLGTCLHVISMVSFWDKVLHAISPMVLTAFGYGLIGYLLKQAAIKDTSPWLFLLMGFAFAGLCGVFWEFWEFFCDVTMDMNLQRYQTSGGVDLVGHTALMDTMGDLITNTLGALVMGIYAWSKSRSNPAYFDNYRLSKVQ